MDCPHGETWIVHPGASRYPEIVVASEAKDQGVAVTVNLWVKDACCPEESTATKLYDPDVIVDTLKL